MELNDIIKLQKAIKMQMKVIDNAIKSSLKENKEVYQETKVVDVGDAYAEEVQAENIRVRLASEAVQSPKDVEEYKEGEPDIDGIAQDIQEQKELTGLN